MTTAQNPAQTRVKGDPLGYAQGLTIRFIFLREIDWLPPHRRRRGIDRIEDREMKLHDLQQIIDREASAKPLQAPLLSFYQDITLTEDGARRLPIITACAASKAGQISDKIKNSAPPLKVRIPGIVSSEWEGDEIKTEIVEAVERDKTNGTTSEETESNPHERDHPPLDLTCDFTDSMAFFGSGHVAYSLSVILTKESFPTEKSGAEAGADDTPEIPVHPGIILSLLDLARFTDRPPEKQIEVRFGFENGLADMTLEQLVSHRLRSLADGTAKGAALLADNSNEECVDIFRAIIGPIRKSKRWPDDATADIGEFAEFKLSDLQSATCEIAGFTEFDRLNSYAARAPGYDAPADSFGKGLAGLAQNVIDFENQDKHEVNDSLAAAGSAGGYFHFINAKAIVRFYGESRSFQRLQNFIGGDPYFYFTVLASVYNEYLVGKAVQLMSELRPGSLIQASPFKSTRAELETRYRIFAGCLRPIIPNFFRYKTEAALFDHIHERRGIASKRDVIEKELSRYETIAHDFESLNSQRSDKEIGLLVIVLAFWSMFGSLVGAASLFVAFHSDDAPYKLHMLVIDFTRAAVLRFLDVFLWASLAGLIVSLLVSLYYIGKRLVTWFKRIGATKPG